MHGTLRAEVAGATKIDGHFRPAPTKLSCGKFGAVAKVLWPCKTANVLACIADTDERTARRWLRGEFDPPGIVIAAIINEITKRE
jgi:hypothetical protein